MFAEANSIKLCTWLTMENLKIKKSKFNFDDSTTYRQSTHLRVSDIDSTRINDTLNWCQEHFGDEWIWTRLYDYSYDFYFLSQEHVLMFKLRWC